MPYKVTSRCEKCSGSDEFMIGNWKEHLGVYICPSPCQTIFSVPLDTAACPGCGRPVSPDECYDYAHSIPHMNGSMVAAPERGPECPKCCRGYLKLRPTIHHNMLMVLGGGNTELWLGKDYLEKEIFGHALAVACFELQLEPKEQFSYFDLDMTPRMDQRIRTCGLDRGLSTPIVMDICIHLSTQMGKTWLLEFSRLWGAGLDLEDLLHGVDS